jgi:hypothetical protein
MDTSMMFFMQTSEASTVIQKYETIHLYMLSSL